MRTNMASTGRSRFSSSSRRSSSTLRWSQIPERRRIPDSARSSSRPAGEALRLSLLDRPRISYEDLSGFSVTVAATRFVVVNGKPLPASTGRESSTPSGGSYAHITEPRSSSTSAESSRTAGSTTRRSGSARGSGSRTATSMAPSVRIRTPRRGTRPGSRGTRDRRRRLSGG